VGVYKALQEKGIKFDLAFGTSIGGLNATMIAQGHIERLEHLWSTLKASDIFHLPSASMVGRLVLGHKLGLLDTTPLETLLRRELNLQALKQSRMKVGLCTTDLCSLETRLITIDDVMSTNELVDVLMATSAIPMAFPPRHINGAGLWVDGGLVRNTPMETAIQLGADEIFMVLLHPEKINVCPTNMFEVLVRCLDIVLDASARREIQSAELYNRLIATGSTESIGRKNVDIRVFQPRRAVNTTLLEIDPERSRRLIAQGYEDAMLQLSDYKPEVPDSNRTESTESSEINEIKAS
jgi:predicted acylesterase/phospholipase RssA